MQPYVLKLQFGDTIDVNTVNKLAELERQPVDSIDSVNLLRKFITPPLAELVGTTILAFFSMILSLPSSNQQLTSAIFEGAATFVLMSLLGQFSGGHFNPAITLAVGCVGHCRFVLGTLIIFAQFLGSFIAALFCRALLADAAFNSTFKYGTSENDRFQYTNSAQVFFFDVLLTILLCSAYLFKGVNTKGRDGQLCAALVGLTRSLVTYVGYRTIGHCANMSISFGISISAALFLCESRLWSLLYITVFANLIGAFLAGLCYCIFYRQAPVTLSDVNEQRSSKIYSH